MSDGKDNVLKDIKQFPRDKALKETLTNEKNPLPTINTLYEELLPDNIEVRKELAEIKNFVKEKLSRIRLNEKNHLPTKDEIEAEKIDSRAFVKEFDKSNLKHVEVKESNTLPTANSLREELLPDILPTKTELDQLRTFIRSYLKHIETNVKDKLPSKKEIEQESVNTRSEIINFNKEKLNPVETVEKNPLPTQHNLFLDLLPDILPSKPDLEALKSFIHDKLNHVETVVHDTLPTAEQIQSEKETPTQKIKDFNKDDLKHVNTAEKNSLPTQSDLRAELLPDYLPRRQELEALKNFVKESLKHVECVVKDHLPTHKDVVDEKINTRAEVKDFDKTTLKHV